MPRISYDQLSVTPGPDKSRPWARKDGTAAATPFRATGSLDAGAFVLPAGAGAAATGPGTGAPLVIVVQSARGEARVPVQDDPDLGAAVSAAVLIG